MPHKTLSGSLREARFLDVRNAYDWAWQRAGLGGGRNDQLFRALWDVVPGGAILTPFPFLRCTYILDSSGALAGLVFWFQDEPDASAIPAQSLLRDSYGSQTAGSLLLAQFGGAVSSCPQTLTEARMAAQR